MLNHLRQIPDLDPVRYPLVICYIAEAMTQSKVREFSHEKYARSVQFPTCYDILTEATPASTVKTPVVTPTLDHPGEEALERQVRLLIAMASISAFGASLFTSQR